jgi:phosphoserine phosphatase
MAEANFEGHIAAFFDLDGTLIPEPSLEWQFFRELRRNHRIPFANYFRWGAKALRLLPQGLLAVQHRNKRYLTGVCCDLVFRHMETIAFFEEGIARVMWHARQGHEIVLVSGTLEALAQLAAAALECELEVRGVMIRPRVCATRVTEVGRRWTGYLEGDALYGAAKARAIEDLAHKEPFDLRRCHVYGNSLLDRHMLRAVGHAHAVNPGKELAALANEKDWPIWRWHQEKQIVSRGSTDLAKEIHHLEETL